jgi:hypothetical protein
VGTGIWNLGPSFEACGSRFRNSLPHDITSSLTLSTFRSRLKTHLFSGSFAVVTHLNSVPIGHRRDLESGILDVEHCIRDPVTWDLESMIWDLDSRILGSRIPHVGSRISDL